MGADGRAGPKPALPVDFLQIGDRERVYRHTCDAWAGLQSDEAGTVRATLERDGRIYSEAAPWDLEEWVEMVPLTGQGLEAFKRYGARLMEQRTLAMTDLLSLSIFSMGVEYLRAAVRAGDPEAAKELKEMMRGLGLLDPDRIEAFRGPRPVLADVLPFRLRRSDEPEHPPAA